MAIKLVINIKFTISAIGIENKNKNKKSRAKILLGFFKTIT
jgi:hypothetical protein